MSSESIVNYYTESFQSGCRVPTTDCFLTPMAHRITPEQFDKWIDEAEFKPVMKITTDPTSIPLETFETPGTLAMFFIFTIFALRVALHIDLATMYLNCYNRKIWKSRITNVLFCLAFDFRFPSMALLYTPFLFSVITKNFVSLSVLPMIFYILFTGFLAEHGDYFSVLSLWLGFAVFVSVMGVEDLWPTSEGCVECGESGENDEDGDQSTITVGRRVTRSMGKREFV
jgi:hypothetical protein